MLIQFEALNHVSVASGYELETLLDQLLLLSPQQQIYSHNRPVMLQHRCSGVDWCGQCLVRLSVFDTSYQSS